LFVLGVLACFAPGARLPELVEARAAWFGITLMVVGWIAVLGSLMSRRPLWYRKPPRWRMLRGQRTDWGQMVEPLKRDRRHADCRR
jgi:hypothetical protein